MNNPGQQRQDILKYIDRCESQIKELQKEIHFKKKIVKILDQEIESKKESAGDVLQEVTDNLK